MVASFARLPLMMVALMLGPVACDSGAPVRPGTASPSPQASVRPQPGSDPTVFPSATMTVAPNVPVTVTSAKPVAGASPAPFTVLSATISLVAGIGASGFDGDGGPAITAKLNAPWGLAFDATGDLWVADAGNSRLRKITKAGDIRTVLGTAVSGYNGDNLVDTKANLSQAHFVAFGPTGQTYVADTFSNRIRRLDSITKLVTTVAGTSGIGSGGFRGDGGPAVQATLSNPGCVIVDGTETLYIADSGNNSVRRVTPDGIITTVAGTGNGGFNGDNKPATTVSLRFPEGLALDKAGNLYIADGGNSRICKLTPDGMLRTIVGNGTLGFSGDGGPAAVASISRPIGMAVAADGTLYFADADNHRVRRVAPDGTIQTIAGGGGVTSTGDDGPALSSGMGRPTWVALDADGNLIVTDSGTGPYDNRVRKISFRR